MLNKYYVDTCIWLNLFKKEGDEKKGVPYWKLAEKFLEKVMFSQNSKIYYSGIVLRELQIKLGEKHYLEKQFFFQNETIENSVTYMTFAAEFSIWIIL